MTQETTYSVNWFGPDELQRAADNVVQCPVRYDGSSALAATDTGTVTIYDESGTAIVDGEDVTITNGIAVYTVTAATLPTTLSLSDRWQEAWALSIGGKAYTFKRLAALVRTRLYPVVDESDLTSLHFEIRLWVDQHDQSIQTYIDSGWKFFETWLRAQGRRPYLVLEPTATFTPHLYVSLSIAFNDMWILTSDDKYKALAEHYREQYDKARGEMQFVYDLDEDGLPDDGETETPAETVIFLCKPGSRWLETV